ncbi:MAG: hypothetical protein HC800_23835 [Phormidesmis sp. RL_2_1]|nr:hypothetical protein [Phormidesmis sp. RL_2_1]
MITNLCPPSNTGIGSMINLDDFLTLIELLETKGIDYALVGGVAMMAIAPNARATDDYDFIGQRSDFESISELSKVSSDQNFGRYRHNTTIVDTLFVENPVFAHALDAYQADCTIAGKTVRSLSPSGIALLKLYALPSLYLQGQHIRVAAYEQDLEVLFIVDSRINEDALLKFLGKHLVQSQIVELNNTCEDIRRKLSRQRF